MQDETNFDAFPKSVAIVGNAPDMADQSTGIDAADWVLRFNNAAGFGTRAGCRVTHLALVNHGGQMREWLEDDGFIRRPVVRGARHVLFPFPPKSEPVEIQDADGRDWTREAEALLRPLGASIAILPEALHREAAAILLAAGRPGAVPSTGFLVALHFLGQLPATVAVAVHGFGFAGWEGHGWEAERRWFEAMQEAGRLRLHSLGASGAS